MVYEVARFSGSQSSDRNASTGYRWNHSRISPIPLRYRRTNVVMPIPGSFRVHLFSVMFVWPVKFLKNKWSLYCNNSTNSGGRYGCSHSTGKSTSKGDCIYIYSASQARPILIAIWPSGRPNDHSVLTTLTPNMSKWLGDPANDEANE